MKKIWARRLLGFFLAVAVLTVMASCGNKDKGAEGGQASGSAEGDGEHTYYNIEITIKDYGTVKVQLDATAAPITTENFVKLAEDGFYDGLTFHRIIKGFMIQGGDPLGTGRGGSGETIKGEFSKNGVSNGLSHTRGAISMARSNPYDSASSQFFIVHEDSTHLDGKYACFGYVTEGMEVVDAICDQVPVGENGAVEKQDQPVIESVKVINSDGQ